MSKLMDFRTIMVVTVWLGVFAGTSEVAATENIVVEHGYARATIPGTNISSAYMNILNKMDKNVTLVGASSDVSNRVEIHEHSMENGMMKMRQRELIDIDANSEMTLQPSGYHLMIFDLEKPLEPKQQLKLTLHFAKQADVEINIPVKSIKRKKQIHHHH